MLKVHAFVRKDGKDWIVQRWIKMRYNVYPIVVDMVTLTWIHNRATANRNGVVMIVQRVTNFLFFSTLYRPELACVKFVVVFYLELCDLDCGQHGRCVGETCTCDNGWGGEYCNTKLCDLRCNEHGQCKNGTCLCVTGWNGKHCTIEGCPAGCSNHGQCRVSGEGLWECRCYDGWDGVDCAVALEQNCADNKDNDKGK